MPSKKLAAVIAFGVLLAAPPVANADHVEPNLGLEVTAVDPSTRTVEGIQHCTGSDRDGRNAGFRVTRSIDLDQFLPGVVTGVALDAGGVILGSGPPPCDIRPQAQTTEKPHQGRKARSDDGADQPTFSRSFLRRVWKFRVEIEDVAGPGELRVTFGHVLNLPKGMKAQDDDLTGAAGIAVLRGGLQVRRSNGKPGPMGDIAKLKGDAVITGKMLPRSRWKKDRDGKAVPTIHVRVVTLLS